MALLKILCKIFSGKFINFTDKTSENGEKPACAARYNLILRSRSSFSQSEIYDQSMIRHPNTSNIQTQNTGSSRKKSGEISPTRIPSPITTVSPTIKGLVLGKAKRRIISPIVNIPQQFLIHCKGNSLMCHSVVHVKICQD